MHNIQLRCIYSYAFPKLSILVLISTHLYTRWWETAQGENNQPSQKLIWKTHNIFRKSGQQEGTGSQSQSWSFGELNPETPHGWSVISFCLTCLNLDFCNWCRPPIVVCVEAHERPRPSQYGSNFNTQAIWTHLPAGWNRNLEACCS